MLSYWLKMYIYCVIVGSLRMAVRSLKTGLYKLSGCSGPRMLMLTVVPVTRLWSDVSSVFQCRLRVQGFYLRRLEQKAGLDYWLRVHKFLIPPSCSVRLMGRPAPTLPPIGCCLLSAKVEPRCGAYQRFGTDAPGRRPNFCSFIHFCRLLLCQIHF